MNDPFKFFVEAANNGFCSNIAISRAADRIQYNITLVLPQASPQTLVESPEKAAEWLEETIIGWFPESDFAKRLLREKALAEQQEKLQKTQH